MRKQETQATTPKSNKGLVVAFEKILISKISKLFTYKSTISDSEGRKTHAFGETKCKAQENAIRNFNQKYNTAYFSNSF